MGKSISGRLDDKFKSVFRILFAWLDKSVCLPKTLLQYYVARVSEKTENHGIESP